MDSNIGVLNQIRKDIEEKLNVQLSSILQTNCTPEELTERLNISQLEDEVGEKYIQEMVPASIKFHAESEELWASLTVTNYDDYDKISQNLNNKRNVSSQIRALDKLLAAYAVDTKVKSWLPLSRNLQKCCISTNNEIFKRSLKIHFKLISAPTTCSEGYLNLIQALILMFNTDFFKNSHEINESNNNHKHVISMLKLVLKSQKVLLKNWLHAKKQIAEEVLITFIYMLNCSLGSEHKLGAIDFIALLDHEAKWFKKFCCSLQTRSIILACLKKTPNLIHYFVEIVTDYMNDEFYPSKNYKRFLNYSHCAHFLSQFLIYRQSLSVFPIKVSTSPEPFTFECFVLTIITKLSSWSENPRKKIAVELLQSLLTNHCRLLLNPEIRAKLFEPFVLKVIDKTQFYAIVERNRFVLEIMNNLSRLQSSKQILFILSDLKMPERRYRRRSLSKDQYNILQIIVNATITGIRNFINKSEVEQQVNNVIFELIDCCCNLFHSHAQTFSLINTAKLVTALRDLYKTVMNHDSSSIYYKPRIATSLCFFIESDVAALKILESESALLREIVCNALAISNSLRGENKLYSKLILNIAHHKEGNKIIMHNHDLLLRDLLLKTWAAENDEDGFILDLNIDFELHSNKLLHFLHTISYSFQAVRALLAFENEGTVVENQERPLVLAELVENCLDTKCSEATDTVIGLKIIKVLITNADVLLYLQNNYRLQENLIELQVNCRMPCSDDGGNVSDSNATAILIDECSLLRHNILLSIKYIGKMCTALDEKLLGQAQLVVAPYQSSSALKKLQKAPSELQRFLHDTRNGLHDYNWLIQARRIFKDVCRDKYKTSVITELLEQIPKTALAINYVWPSPNAVLFGLCAEECHGVTLIVRYGIQSGILNSSASNEDTLTLLLKQARTFLGCRSETFSGFDWFVAVVFLICSGNFEKCKITLLNVVNTPAAPIIWPVFLWVTDSGQKVCNHFYRQLEIILDDTSRLNCALESLGVSARHLAQKWLSHCFFTILDFSEICNFIAVAILYPPEYILFFVLAVFEHLKSAIYTATHTANIITVLRMSKALDFHVMNYFGFIDKLSKQYKNCLRG